ncbi:hypothetical protein BJ978_000762 [Agromyces terreus]|uniref:Transmembrane protein n=1 Tax=Agromyces terreus TaxID=424795 RepID=A0A9X2GZ28_9MICO|nr:hypothetical protein [Agromyces terreus]
MTRRSGVRTPAVIALAATFVGSILALQGVWRVLAAASEEINRRQSQAMTAEESNELFRESAEVYAWLNFGWAAAPTLGVLAAASALALVFVWCFWPRGAAPAAAQSSDGTRTMSAAGSTVNRAETTVPNSSPSTSNSSAPSPISMSTERPRE